MAAPQPMVVQTGTWLDGMTPYSQGAYFVRARTVVMIVPGSHLVTRYGGADNLASLRANQTGDDADHSHLAN